jgi:hypothetical protein
MPKGIYKKEGYNGSPIERFLRHVNKSDKCWIWVGCKVGNGYGHFRNDSGLILAHRFSYQSYIGPIPKDMNVLHSCDNPSCVNPEHLSLGTHTQNMRDMWSKGRNTHKGEKNTKAKLSWEKVSKMRNMYNSGKYSQKELSIIFGVVRSVICGIVTNKLWVIE